MRTITRLEREQLKGFERFAFAVAAQANRPQTKRLLHRFLATVGRDWVRLGSGNLQRIHGLEQVRDFMPDRGVLLVSNHRSFFDMYVLSSVLLGESKFIREMYFPIRSRFFYQRPLGVSVNLALAMMSMYPPILHGTDRRLFNRFTVEFLIEKLKSKGTLVGFHPEGTRGKGPDPFAMLPAQPGVGEIAYHARPIVIPVFVRGLSNDIVKQVRGNFDGTGAPIEIVFGAPSKLDRKYAQEASVATYQSIANQLRNEILALGTQLQAPAHATYFDLTGE